MCAPEIENGWLDMNNGRIVAMGAGDPPEDSPAAGAACGANGAPAIDIYDAHGGFVLPGFVDAHCHLGMWENALGFEGDDGNEDADPVTPQLRALDAVNALDACFGEALAAGITAVVTGPGSANPVGGQSLAMKTYGRRVDDMVVKAPLAMKMALGENPKTVYHGKNQSPVTRMATAAIIRGALSEARAYKEKQHSKKDPPDWDAKNEALLPVLDGAVPVHIHAHRIDDIFTAQRLAAEFGFHLIIIHGTGAHVAPDLITAPVLCGPLLCDRSKPELKDLSLASPALLHAAGVPIAIVTDHPVVPIQYLALEAALAVREGLPRDEALRAITLNPARILGLEGRVGSLAPGLDADVLVFDGDPLAADAKPAVVFAAGMRVPYDTPIKI